MLASLVFACVAAAPAAPVLGGYLPFYRLPDFDLKRLAPYTDVMYFSVQPTPEGQIDTNGLRLEDLPNLVKAKRRYGFRLILCCGGWERSAGFMPMASVPERRSLFVDQVDRFLDKHGFDGIDLDWEHPKDAAEAKAYGALITDLHRALAPDGRIVTAAIASWQAMDSSAVKSLDRVNLMSYDHGGRHATMDLAKADVAKLRAMGFPSEKIVLGVPLYGRNLKAPDDAKSYAELRTLYKILPEADEAGDYYFNGAKTVQAKAKYARKEKLAGVMVWEVSHDATGVDSLVVQMRAAMGLSPRS